jgi:hypothetical protein
MPLSARGQARPWHEEQDAAEPDLLLGQFLQGFSKGQFSRAEAREQYRNVPATIACAILYWRAVDDGVCGPYILPQPR